MKYCICHRCNREVSFTCIVNVVWQSKMLGKGSIFFPKSRMCPGMFCYILWIQKCIFDACRLSLHNSTPIFGRWCISISSFFMSRFGITEFVITETLWSSVIFKTIMVPLHRRRFLFVHLYSNFSVDPWIFSWGQIYTKNCYFWRFWRP